MVMAVARAAARRRRLIFFEAPPASARGPIVMPIVIM
jgi:hypothetical protein